MAKTEKKAKPEQEAKKNAEPQVETPDTETAAAEAEAQAPDTQPDEAAPDARLQELEAQLLQANDKFLRTLAEYDNYRKRSVREKEQAYADSKAAVLTEFLPVLDNFERAQAGADAVKFQTFIATAGVSRFAEKAQYQKEKGLHLKVEIEVRTFEEIRQVLQHGGADRIMFDNFSVADTREAVKLIDHKMETESSGGITFDTIRDYAECGVDYISVGALTHSVKGLDMSFKAV